MFVSKFLPEHAVSVVGGQNILYWYANRGCFSKALKRWVDLFLNNAESVVGQQNLQTKYNAKKPVWIQLLERGQYITHSSES